MFGLSLGEIMILLLVGIVVVGPKKLPEMMRTAGQWVTRLRRMSTELRSQSGIDELIRHEGLERELHELRSLSRMNVVDTLMAPALAATAPRPEAPKLPDFKRSEPLREREYPLVGCDAGGALADDAVQYSPHDGAMAPPSPAPAEAGAPMIELGEATITIPPETPPETPPEASSEPALPAAPAAPAPRESPAP